jgi:hypothetical protein
MRSSWLVLSLSLFACGGEQSAVPPTAPKASEPAVSSSSPPPITSATATPCGTKLCQPPATCVSVVGMVQGSSRQECWISCAHGESCPKGMTCTMVHDGPGQVCIEADKN